MNSSGNQSDITVLERQRVRMKWQQNQNQNASSQGSTIINMNNMITTCDSQGLQIPIASSPAPSFDTISTPSLANPKLTHSNKRKPHHHHHPPPIPKVVVESVNKDKRIKVVVPEDDDDDGESKNNTTDANSKNNNKEKNSAAAADTCSNSKPDYIHVRARRGQATDSHSLAERVRREKISERMKFLQDLVPGCNKITGKAGMLDEIINYVQSLQRQVEFLSMKLATVNPSLDFNIDHLFDKEVFSTCDGNTSFQGMGMSSEMNNNPYLQFNSPHQIVSYGGLDTGMNMNTSDMGLRRTISAPVSIPETFIDSSSFSHILPSSTWEGDFQNIYNSLTLDQPRLTSFPSQLFTGLVEASNLKMEM